MMQMDLHRMHSEGDTARHIGLAGATGIGVGAIVGGGVLALAGVAFQTTGPSAVLAFLLNGVIAALTAMSFAALAARFPQSGGTYAYARRLYSVETAFVVGWVVWFASIAAAALYGLGLAQFALLMLESLLPRPGALQTRPVIDGAALAGVAWYALRLTRRPGGGSQWETVAKVVLFLVVIAGGLWAMAQEPLPAMRDRLTPFLSRGAFGLVQAMGYTFIALQGFDLIAAVGGEIRDPRHTLPRAMFASLGIALAIYLPLLITMTCVGLDGGGTILDAARADPSSVVAVAAKRFWGPVGYWIVLVAGVLAMASALQANLYAASRVATAMARDRTLPDWLGNTMGPHRIPVAGIWLSAALCGGVVVLMPSVAAAGAASSLIFLVTFALAHQTSWLARRRVGRSPGAYATPWFPVVPLAGGGSCLALAIFQGVAVPAAGLVTLGWAAVGGVLYSLLFARKARVTDAGLEAVDPQLAQLRGKSPLVLVPIANPANAPTLLDVAHAIASPGVGRVLMLSVVCPLPGQGVGGFAPHVANAQQVLRESLLAAIRSGRRSEALTTLADQPWNEIARVARVHRCESLLIGFGRFDDEMKGSELEHLVSRVDCDVALLRAPPRWTLADVQRMLIPIAGRGGHEILRARLLAGLFREGVRQFCFLRILPTSASDAECRRAEREVRVFIRDEVPGRYEVITIRCDDVADGIVRHARDCGLLALGLQRYGRRHKGFGRIVLRVAEQTPCPLILISSRG